jgi:hypothetical protein
MHLIDDARDLNMDLRTQLGRICIPTLRRHACSYLVHNGLHFPVSRTGVIQLRLAKPADPHRHTHLWIVPEFIFLRGKAQDSAVSILASGKIRERLQPKLEGCDDGGGDQR